MNHTFDISLVIVAGTTVMLLLSGSLIVLFVTSHKRIQKLAEENSHLKQKINEKEMTHSTGELLRGLCQSKEAGQEIDAVQAAAEAN